MRDVIVIGAGPAGSRCAARLGEYGRDVLIIEAQPSVPVKPVCTGLVSHKCALKFDIPDSAILRDARSARLFSPSGQSLHIYRDDPQACVIDRTVLHADLAEKALAAGVEYRYGCHVTGITNERSHVRVTFEQAGCTSHEDARAAVIACGCSPHITESAGLGRPQRLAAGAQAIVTTDAVLEVEVHTGSLSPGFFGWMVPAEPGQARIGLLAHNHAADRLRRWLDALAAAGKLPSSDIAIHTGIVPLSPLPRTYSERILAVGDAAGHVKPTSGGGIYYGLLGADAAAETLHEALGHDDLSARFLSRYEDRWRQIFGQEVRRGLLARNLYEKLNDRWDDRLFLAARRAGIERAVAESPDIDFDRHAATIRRLATWRRFKLLRGLFGIAFHAGILFVSS